MRLSSNSLTCESVSLNWKESRLKLFKHKVKLMKHYVAFMFDSKARGLFYNETNVESEIFKEE